VGETSTATLDVCNTGNGNLCVENILSKDPVFEVTEPSSGYPVTVSHDFCFPFEVKFTPTEVGAVASMLTISSSDPGAPLLGVNVSGRGTRQSIATVIADNGAFGDVCRKTFKDLDLTISNWGGCDLLITNITSSSPEFRTASVMSFPLVIQRGTSTHVAIRLAPTSLGAKSADITITSNDPNVPTKVIRVTGNTPPGSLRLTGSTDFGDVCAGTLAEKQLAVCNVGSCHLNVGSAAFVGSCPDFTLIRNPFPAAVSPDSCQNLTIRFTPTSCGQKACTLRIGTDDPSALATDVAVTANTPCSQIDVPPDQAFPPTVIQSVGACQSQLPFPVSNTGTCNLNITNVAVAGTNGSDYSLAGLPSFPIILQPGHVTGEGNLKTVFKPTALDRDRLGNVTVTYESDPITHAATNVTRALCGEGVRTGARVLVRAGGVPLATVEKIQLQRITGNRNRNLLDTNNVAMNLALQTVTPAAPCTQFQYHREYGTVSNPIQLLPGSYQVTATAIVNGKRKSQTVGFSVDTCGFNPTIIIDL
jgi:hypothetical protein